MLKLFLLVCFSANVLVHSFPLEDNIIEEHIVGGNDTDISKIPYQVVLYVESHFICGGFIVSPTYVVTAAHCAIGEAEKMSIRAGSSSNKEGGVVIKVKQYYRHPQYSLKDVDYDAAVLELQTPLKYTDKIKPIKLTSKEPVAGTMVLASGWGAMNEELELPDTLQSVTFPIFNRTACEVIYAIRRTKITPRMICAGCEGKSAYFGDSGGPVVYKGEVIGIVSFGAGCAKRNLPGVYANVANEEINKFIKSIAKL